MNDTRRLPCHHEEMGDMCARGAHSHVPDLTHCFNSAYPQVKINHFFRIKLKNFFFFQRKKNRFFELFPSESVKTLLRPRKDLNSWSFPPLISGWYLPEEENGTAGPGLPISSYLLLASPSSSLFSDSTRRREKRGKRR